MDTSTVLFRVFHRGEASKLTFALTPRTSFVVWQLRASYLSTIKDGIGDRLISPNDAILYTPGFRSAGWSSLYANSAAHPAAAAHIKRTYSPPIPTTAAVSSEYYRFSELKGVNGATDEVKGLGLADDLEDDEAGMVTGKGSSETIGPRHHTRSAKKARRRDPLNSEQRGPDGAEDDDSSDLSDESDDDDALQR